MVSVYSYNQVRFFLVASLVKGILITDRVTVYSNTIDTVTNVPRWAKWLVFVIELNLLLPCLSSWHFTTTTTTPDPARQPGTTPPINRQYDHIRTYSVQLSKKTHCPPPFTYLGILFIYSMSNTIEGRKTPKGTEKHHLSHPTCREPLGR